MKFPVSMLREMVETHMTAEEIGDLLTMAGFELEGIEDVDGEPVLDIKVVSNRGDGLSVLGLAREVLAKDADSRPTELYRRSSDRFSGVSTSDQPSSIGLVTLDCPDCSRYACYVVENLRNEDSPEWIQQRIRQAGWRPISLLVDLTNYVLLEQGQPLHAFDFDLLSGNRIVVRHACPGEKLQTLNGDEHDLQPGQMMICDAERPVAAAGIMGGLATEVCVSTSRTLLESAHFLNTSVRRTRKQLGLSTEASYRFERSVDPEGVVAALHRMVELLRQVQPQLKITAFMDVYPSPPAPVMIDLLPQRASKLLGMEISKEQSTGYLERLGFSVDRAASSPPDPLTPSCPTPALSVRVPTWRPDVVREEDLVEELGRVHGYEKIPALLPFGTTTQGGVFGFEAFVDRIREECVRLGLQQVISHSLRDLHSLDALGKRVGPRNPNSPEMAHLRNSLWPNLAEVAKRNDGKDVQLFEIGRVFLRHSASTDRLVDVERIELALLLAGSSGPSDWIIKSPPPLSFFWLKSVIENIARVAGSTRLLVWDLGAGEDGPDPRLHPMRQARLSAGTSEIVASAGQIHPDVAMESGLPAETYFATVNLPDLFDYSGSGAHLRSVSRHPSVRRDLAILAKKTLTFEALASAITVSLGNSLEESWLFDVYEGEGIPEGMHSLGIALQLRKPDSTFTDEEANQVRERAVKAIESLGATTR